MDYFEDYDELVDLPKIKNMPITKPEKEYRRKSKKSDKHEFTELKLLSEQQDDVSEYQFSYEASRHEREWILDSLGLFYQMQWFADILRLVKGGKEASVYQCLPSPASPVEGSYLAAKVYRPRRFRNLKNDHIYREGRVDLDTSGNAIIKEKMLKAIRQRSDYGRKVMHTSWLEHEFKTMKILYEAGADIPRPYASGSNAILMDYIGGVEFAAPTLNTVDLDSSEANILFGRVLHNIEIMLEHERVHADLSAYNILYWHGEIKLIDFPQAISPDENNSAYIIFRRDVRRICDYFRRQGVQVDDQDLARKLWQKYRFRQMPEFSLTVLDEEDQQDREYWNRLKDRF
ncbi:MAG: hypothetical protein JSV42_15125 [Chloroflexota bacterium]|nr:MAG: hypothetical protein JSV42_15125 [Chloroflexota bacterium]